MLGRREENRRDDEQIPRWWSDETHALSSCRRYGVHACSIARSLAAVSGSVLAIAIFLFRATEKAPNPRVISRATACLLPSTSPPMPDS
jgi:hypothetical protein